MTEVESKLEVLKALEKEKIRLLGQIDDLTLDAAEHRLVLKTLSALPQERRCFRIIGGVAVERTIEQVVPALQAHADKMDQISANVNQKLKQITDEIQQLSDSVKSLAEVAAS